MKILINRLPSSRSLAEALVWQILGGCVNCWGNLKLVHIKRGLIISRYYPMSIARKGSSAICGNLLHVATKQDAIAIPSNHQSHAIANPANRLDQLCRLVYAVGNHTLARNRGLLLHPNRAGRTPLGACPVARTYRTVHFVARGTPSRCNNSPEVQGRKNPVRRQ